MYRVQYRHEQYKTITMVLNVWHCPGVTMRSAGMHYGTATKGPSLRPSATICQRARLGSIA